MARRYNIFVHEEDGSYWAEVDQLPGCFASGGNIDELFSALAEAVRLYVSDAVAHER